MSDPRTGEGPRRTAVLVHGAWHGGWCWERVVAGLSARGISAVAPDLPGHGADPGPPGDLHADAARVCSVLDDVDGPVVLVGHSYGGIVVTEAGVHPAVSHVVYLCALAPDLDESGSTVGDAFEEAQATSGPSGLLEAISVSDDGILTVDPELAGAALYNECDATTAAWAVARLGPQPLVTLEQSPQAVAWRERPTTYVVCERDRSVPPALQRELAKRCTTSVTWPCDHSPFLSRPELVVDLVASLVEGGVEA